MIEQEQMVLEYNDFRLLKVTSFHGKSVFGTDYYYEGTVNEKGEPHGIGRRVYINGQFLEGEFENGVNSGYSRFFKNHMVGL